MNERDEKIKEALEDGRAFAEDIRESQPNDDFGRQAEKTNKEALALLSAEPQPVPEREEAARELAIECYGAPRLPFSPALERYIQEATALILAHEAEIEARVRAECAEIVRQEIIGTGPQDATSYRAIDRTLNRIIAAIQGKE